MNKGITIGVIVLAIIITGAAVLIQNNSQLDTTIVVTDIETGETKAKSFEIGLQESVGMTEYP